MALTIELTRHTILLTLTGYITSETDAGLKRNMFGMSDGGDLGVYDGISGWTVDNEVGVGIYGQSTATVIK
jgi:hypothetical protein